MLTDSRHDSRPVDAMRHIAVLAVALAALLPGASSSLAEEGNFRFLRSLVSNNSTVEHAGARIVAGSLTGTDTILEASGEPFVAGEHAAVACLVYARISKSGVDLEAPCTMTDGDGDNLYFMATRRSGDLQEGGGGQGHMELLGGTGKYTGIVGACPYETTFLPGDRSVTQADCAWRRASE